LAVKIVRQPNKIALIGAPTSAGAHSLGLEKAPAALRAAGLVEKLQAAGYEVADLGDCPQQVYQRDDERPRARNMDAVVAALNALKPLVEQATKAGALPLILGGDCTIALGTIAGLRRYYRAVSLIYFDRDADLNIPATTPSGCLDGMGVAHITGRGAPELVRFWGEPPLVREPEIALFGLDRLDPPEQTILDRTPIRRYNAADVQRRGPTACAQEALERTHGTSNQFLLHFDVDVISSEDIPAVDVPGTGGLRLDEVREALAVFAKADHLAAIEVTEYNPERDADGSAARKIVELLTEALSARLTALTAPPAPVEETAAAPAASTDVAPAPAESAEPPAPEEKAAEAPAPAASTEAAAAPAEFIEASMPIPAEAAPAAEETVAPAAEETPAAASNEPSEDSASEPQSSGT
jgi:arginase